MSWAARRKATYAIGVITFFVFVVGAPLVYWYISIPETCTDGRQNQGETAPDRGGPCPLLDTNTLSPSAVLWSRSFRVRDGSYNSVAYVQNPNEHAGVMYARYRFGLYDDRNVLVADRTGTTFIMPGGVTPVFEGDIESGNRVVSRTYFELAEPLEWERMEDISHVITVGDISLTDANTAPRITATAKNTSVAAMKNIRFIISVFDPAGNSFAASQTAIPDIGPGEEKQIVFTWPDPFLVTAGRVDILPVSVPKRFGE